MAKAEALMNTAETQYEEISIPQGFAPTKVEGKDTIDDGIVITDSVGNEYVWIEVPRTAEVYITSGVNIKDFTDLEYDNIEKDLYPYTNVTLSQAERLAERVSVGDYTSSLMFGIQWDLTLKFFLFVL